MILRRKTVSWTCTREVLRNQQRRSGGRVAWLCDGYWLGRWRSPSSTRWCCSCIKNSGGREASHELEKEESSWTCTREVLRNQQIWGCFSLWLLKEKQEPGKEGWELEYHEGGEEPNHAQEEQWGSNSHINSSFMSIREFYDMDDNPSSIHTSTCERFF